MSSNSNNKRKRSQPSSPPLPRRQQQQQHRQYRQVLTEEEYSSTLSDIVQREYFPDLSNLRRRVAVLERRDVGDVAGAVAIRGAARQLEDHEASLADEEDRAEHDLSSSGRRRVPRPLHRETLSGFHERVTSEDNAEFDATQKRDNQTNRDRLGRVFAFPQLPTNQSHRHNNQEQQRITAAAGHETPLGLASDQFNPSPHRIAASEWKKTTETSVTNGLFFHPSSSSSFGSSGGEVTDAARSSSLYHQTLIPNGANDDDPSSSTLTTDDDDTTTRKKLQQLLMPPPATRGDVVVAKHNLVEYIPKHELEKRIDPSQTRFPAAAAAAVRVVPSLPLLQLQQQQQQQQQQLTIGNGEESTTDYSTEASTDLDATPLPISVERNARAKRQKREQETFVQMTPHIVPGRRSISTATADAGNESPIVTWGTVSATPLVLRSGGGGTAEVEDAQFRLPETSKRDEVARRAQAALERRRRKTRQASSTRSTAIPLDRLKASLTPAAQSLLNKTRPSSSSSSSVRSSIAFSSALRSSYTPKRGSTKSRKRDAAGKVTPRVLPGGSHKQSVKDGTKTDGNITDGLLKLS